MSNAMERIKNKIRNSNGSSVHSQLIDTENATVVENKNGNVNVNVDTYVLPGDTLPETRIGPAKREKRKKFEELYKRDTFWIQNELKDRLDAYCKGERGEKTRIINEALKEYMEKM